VQGFGGKPQERDHSEDRGIDGRMGSECILERLAGRCKMDNSWWQVVINAVMNLQVLAP
jgi:hypothetical protein